jgi:integrase
MPQPIQWFHLYLKDKDIPHGTGYFWWKAFCADTTRTILPADATAADREAFAAWVDERRARKATARARKVARRAARDEALAACAHEPRPTQTLADLLTALTARGDLKPHQVRNYQTSVRYLAKALGADSPEGCLVDAALAHDTAWGAALETHFAAEAANDHPINAGTRKNTKNNLKGLFSKAEAAGLLDQPLPSRLLERTTRHAFLAKFHKEGPYRATYIHPDHQRYGLHQSQWPADIQAGWEDYERRVFTTTRPRTRAHTATILATYFGWLQHIKGETPTWDALFVLERVQAFVLWHSQRVGKQLSAHGLHLIAKAAAIAKAQGHGAATALAAYRETLDAAEGMHVKPHHMLTLKELDEVGNACLREGRVPILRDKDSTKSPGLRRASRFQLGLLIKLWVRIPIRQRNVREMQQFKNLTKRNGQWSLHYQGAELKVGKRGRDDNTYTINISARYPELVKVMEEWIDVYRPRIPGADTSPYVFLMQSGRPFTASALRIEIAHVIAQRKGIRFFPHMFRTVWATEYLEADKTRGDFAGAATMLGDTINMTIKTYYHVVAEDHQKRGADFVHEHVGTD